MEDDCILDFVLYDTNVDENAEESTIEPEQTLQAPPQAAQIDSSTSLLFQHLDLNYTNQIYLSKSSQDSDKEILRMFGVYENGEPIIANIHGFLLYFYIQAPDMFTERNLDLFTKVLNNKVVVALIQNSIQYKTRPVVKVELVNKYPLYGYQGSKKFLKIFISSPKVLFSVVNVLERTFKTLPGFMEQTSLEYFEKDVDIIMKFMVDAGIVGGCWIEIPDGKWKATNKQLDGSNKPHEVDVQWTDLVCHKAYYTWNKIAPFAILSIKIKSLVSSGNSSNAATDQIVQIANAFTRYGSTDPPTKVIFTLGTCAPITGTTVLPFAKEKDMIELWITWFLDQNPDIVTGFNIQDSDLKYIYNRAYHLGIKVSLGRDKLAKDEENYHSKLGCKITYIPGRVLLDLNEALQKDYKLRSYELGAVSYQFLKEQKQDISNAIVHEIYKAEQCDDFGPRRVATVSVKDATIPLRLLDRLMLVSKLIENAKAGGVRLRDLLCRGPQIVFHSLLLRKCSERGYVIPNVTLKHIEDLSGGVVFEPLVGYYDLPIVVLSFDMLYPTIMISHNLCFTTLLSQELAKRMKEKEDYYVTPCKNAFVTQKLRKGILPEILEDLLMAYRETGMALQSETDANNKCLLQLQQNALKLAAYSVYGCTGSQFGKHPCLPISQSVTAFGRQILKQAKLDLEDLFSTKNGYSSDAVVIYGDTGLLMVKFGVESVPEAIEIGSDAAKYITKEFMEPIRMHVDKVYNPFLIMKKKRYFGLRYIKPDSFENVDCKGIETVRRDNCLLVANVIDTCITKILVHKDVDGAINHAQGVIADLMSNKIDIRSFIITKELTKTDYTRKQPHVELAKKMAKRNALFAPKEGDRVPYVVVAKGRNIPLYEKAEDPFYVMELDLPIDVEYYLQQQLQKPLLRLFEHILGKEKTESLLFNGDHMKAQVAGLARYGLTSYMVKVDACLSCKSRIKLDNSGLSKAVCNKCLSKEAQTYCMEAEKYHSLEVQFSKLWSECHRCVGNLQEQVICSSMSCPIFFKRYKVTKDLGRTRQVMERFSPLDW